MRAALYARYSTDKQREVSIDDQYRTCQRVADSNAFRIASRFADEGISGGTADRPGYQQLLDAARRGEFEVIISEDISRLWRNRGEYGARSTELEDLGIHWLSACGDDTRRDGWMVVTIKLALAEQARREISYRTRRGMEGLALSGKSTGGRYYGYRAGEVHELEAEVIRYAYALRADGASLGAITRITGLSRSTIQGILANRRYTGAVVYGATEKTGGARDSRLKRSVARPGGPLVTRQDESKRIVSDELFRACNPESASV